MATKTICDKCKREIPSVLRSTVEEVMLLDVKVPGYWFRIAVHPTVAGTGDLCASCIKNLLLEDAAAR